MSDGPCGHHSALPQPILADLAGRPPAGVQRTLRSTGLDYLILDCPPGIANDADVTTREVRIQLTPKTDPDGRPWSSTRPRKWRWAAAPGSTILLRGDG